MPTPLVSAMTSSTRLSRAVSSLTGQALVADNPSHTKFPQSRQVIGLKLKSVLLTIKDRYFRPSARVREIKETAINQGRYLSNNAANRKLVKPGYLVLFQFDSDTMPDHIGIVVSIDADSVKTVEFNTSAENNTNGGAVSRRDRSFKTIDGFVKLY